MDRRNFVAGSTIGLAGLCLATPQLALAEDGISNQSFAPSEPLFRVTCTERNGSRLARTYNSIESYSLDNEEYEVTGTPTYYTDENGMTHASYEASVRIITANPAYNENSFCRVSMSVSYGIDNGYLYMYRARGSIDPIYYPYSYQQGIMIVAAGLRNGGRQEVHYINQRFPGTHEPMWTEVNLNWSPVVYMATGQYYLNGGTTQAVLENQYINVEVFFKCNAR